MHEHGLSIGIEMVRAMLSAESVTNGEAIKSVASLALSLNGSLSLPLVARSSLWHFCIAEKRSFYLHCQSVKLAPNRCSVAIVIAYEASSDQNVCFLF